MPVATAPSRRVKRPQRLPLGEIEIVRVATPLDLAQAGLMLGEQRAWAERLIGCELADVQPSARHEYSRLADFYGPPEGHLLLARVAEEPVGVVGLHRIDEAQAEGKRLYVRRSARGLGVGRRLVADVVSLARSLGYRSLYVETWPAKTSGSYEMCRLLGFEETRKRGFRDIEGVVAMQLSFDAIAA
jgi:GNAT superfamily N-acetyltransferase